MGREKFVRAEMCIGWNGQGERRMGKVATAKCADKSEVDGLVPLMNVISNSRNCSEVSKRMGLLHSVTCTAMAQAVRLIRCAVFWHPKLSCLINSSHFFRIAHAMNANLLPLSILCEYSSGQTVLLLDVSLGTYSK